MIADSVELVFAALGAGTAAGVSDSASDAVKDAYARLKSCVVKVLDRDDEEMRRHLAEPQTAREELLTALRAAQDDEELTEAARDMLRLAGYVDHRGKFVTLVHDNKGVQIGDNNTMTLNLGE